MTDFDTVDIFTDEIPRRGSLRLLRAPPRAVPGRDAAAHATPWSA